VADIELESEVVALLLIEVEGLTTEVEEEDEEVVVVVDDDEVRAIAAPAASTIITITTTMTAIREIPIEALSVRRLFISNGYLKAHFIGFALSLKNS
jgi:hypothetical protein